MLTVELKVLEGKQAGKCIPIGVKKFIIGRESDCHLRPVSESVSRHHCAFSVDDYTVRLRDLGSTNGTFVNGERIQGHVVLKDGDKVDVGKLSFQIVVKQVVRATAAVAAAEEVPPLGPENVMHESPAEGGELESATPPEFSAQQTTYFGSDTTVLSMPVYPGGYPGQPAAPGMYGFQQPYAQPGYPGFPQPAYPQPGYPQPGFPPQGFGMPQGFPPGFAPGYPPPGYGMPQAYPPAAYPAAEAYPVAAPAQEAPAAEPAKPAKPSKPVPVVPEVMLPDPESTGAKEPVVAAAGAAPSAGATAGGSKPPSAAAADIIRQQLQRRKT